MKTYRVVLDGDVLSGFAPDEVRRQLAKLAGRSEEVAAKLLGGRPSTVKREIDETTASRYVDTLKKIGVACHLEQEHLVMDAEIGQVARPAPMIPTSNANHLARAASGQKSGNMSWNFACSLLVFVLFFSWLVAGAITQTAMGVLSSDHLTIVFGVSFVGAALVAVVFFGLFGLASSNLPFVKTATSGRPGKKFAAVSSILLAISIVFGVVQSYSPATRPPSSPGGSTKATDDLSPAQKAQQDRQRERDVQMAERKERFATQRSVLIDKIKKLNAAGNYQDALDLGSQWLALDPELDAQTDIARAKVAAQAERKNAGLRKTDASHKRGICGEITKGVDLLLYDRPAGHGSTTNCSYTDDRLLVKPNRDIGEERMVRFRFLAFIVVGSLRNDDFELPERVYVGYQSECRVMNTNDAATSQRLVKLYHDDATAWMTIASLPKVACPK